MEDYAIVLRAILDQENDGSCTIIDHSMVRYICLAHAARYPDELNGLGLFHSTSSAYDAGKKRTRARAIEFLRKHSALTLLKQIIPKQFGRLFTLNHKQQII